MTTRHCQTIMSKTIRPGLQALLTHEDNPVHPRTDGDTISVIHSWHPRIDISDHRRPITPTELLDDLAWKTHQHKPGRPLPGDQATGKQLRRYVHDNYPGVLKDLHIYTHSAVLLSTSSFPLEPDAAQRGYVHITPETMLAHGLDRLGAEQAIQQEIRTLQDYLNGAVYSISLENDGETLDSISGIYANSTDDPALGIWQTQDLPSEEQLDQILSSITSPEDGQPPLSASTWTYHQD